ncbi:hypothetical protein N7X57_05365 [Lactiplantibacillus paraplantarum]|uniref:hypothetical protein n=1 Tax=Lactiplantibacillus paraplantarum TaxID=60520 RepID=UPI00051386ED|nr:hypothetical protein [Lactiplantibacillus paraplantarum]OAX76429.1 hypothetical protein A0U96_13930 [Lactiplantibacillus plantarum]ALO03844.1 hypothetical protein ASU28_05535 [Lactiplantibacillus paraplantarum]KGE76656.1 membrane protein [Lactiplantibacillus paraplantarum]MCT4457724.1 hypothetical protein [Lactiplantibacillus paraplantarum]MCW1909875.1 hypothetical protein [Lactiplantibacillus paraplantarum]
MLVVGIILVIGIVGTFVLRLRYHFRLSMGTITETAFACSLLNIGVFLLFILLGQLTGPVLLSEQAYLPIYRLLQGGLIPIIGIVLAIMGMVREKGLMNWWLLHFNILFLIFDVLLVWMGGYTS